MIKLADIKSKMHAPSLAAWLLKRGVELYITPQDYDKIRKELEVAKNPQNWAVKYELDGMSISEYIRAHNLKISAWLVRNRLRKGWDLHRAFHEPNVRYSKKAWEVDGKPLYQWCKENGVKYDGVRARLRRGMSLKKAIATKTERRHNVKWEINGTPLHAYCNLNGINYDLVYNRLKIGWDLQSALTLPKGARYSGERTPSEPQRNEAHGSTLNAWKEAMRNEIAK